MASWLKKGIFYMVLVGNEMEIGMEGVLACDCDDGISGLWLVYRDDSRIQISPLSAVSGGARS